MIGLGAASLPGVSTGVGDCIDVHASAAQGFLFGAYSKGTEYQARTDLNCWRELLALRLDFERQLAAIRQPSATAQQEAAVPPPPTPVAPVVAVAPRFDASTYQRAKKATCAKRVPVTVMQCAR